MDELHHQVKIMRRDIEGYEEKIGKAEGCINTNEADLGLCRR